MEERDWWPLARRSWSPNQDARPVGARPELLVVHAIALPPEDFSGRYVEDFFTNRLDVAVHPYFAGIQHLRVSAHVFIRRDAQAIQFVPFSQRAWHAGVSCWRGRERCNDFSIGIELEGSDTQPFTDEQYVALVSLMVWLQGWYPDLCNPDSWVGHADIAPGRKTDPGPWFAWDRVRAMLRGRVGA